MTIQAVLFANCDMCGDRWEVDKTYRPLRIGFAGDIRDVDVCDKHREEIAEFLVPVLTAGRTPDDVPRARRAPEFADKPFVCECGRAFTSTQGLTRHVRAASHKTAQPQPA